MKSTFQISAIIGVLLMVWLSHGCGPEPASKTNTSPTTRAATTIAPASKTNTSPTTRAATTIAPAGEVVIIKQRETRRILAMSWYLKIDDITGGQVLVEVFEYAGAVIMERRSMKLGDHVDLPKGDSPLVRMTIQRFQNFLIGEDFAEFLFVPLNAAPSMSEAEKIDALLDRIASLSDAVFVRNGSEHSGAEAVEHLKDKWKTAGGADNPNATAAQFISEVATNSKISGRAYRIRFSDGREVESAAWLREQLSQLDPGSGKEQE